MKIHKRIKFLVYPHFNAHTSYLCHTLNSIAKLQKKRKKEPGAIPNPNANRRTP